MKSQIRPSSASDAPAISDFLRRIFGAAPGAALADPVHLSWKCWDSCPGWEGSRSYVMDKDGEILAHVTVVPSTCIDGERRLSVVYPIDWAADPKSVGGGVMLLKRLAQMVDAQMVVGGSEMTQKVLPALGFKTCGEVTKFARPLRPLRRLFRQKLSPRALARFARSLLWLAQAPPLRTQGWTASRVESRALAHASIRWPGAEEGLAFFERTPETFAHLFKCPVALVELYSVATDGPSRGYFLLVYVPGQARIAACHVDSGDPQDWRALIGLAVSQAKRNPNVAEVVSVASDPMMRQALVDCGFHARGSSPMRMLGGKGVTLPAGAIRFQMIDSDAAYLHTGEDPYWA